MLLKKILSQDRNLYLIINVTSARDEPYSELRDILLRGGVGILQLRCKGADDRMFQALALKLRALTRNCNVIYIINDRADIAKLSGADGVHLGQEDISPCRAREILGRDKIIGLSTHNAAQIKKAAAIKCVDYIGIGPIFKTPAKPNAAPVGLSLIKAATRQGKIPAFFAIGGINIKNINSVLAAGARRIAVSSAVLSSRNPAEAAAALRERIDDTD